MWLEFVIDSQFLHKSSLHKFSIPFKQFKDFATILARIVAKSLNCLNGIENLCKEDLCKNCESITNSSHIDVLEMDAASKTGVDDVRDLIEFSRYGHISKILLNL